MRPSSTLFAFIVGIVQLIDAAGNVGSLTTYWHQTSGQVSIVSPTQLKISNFVYDGQGPTDGSGRGTVYFWYGK